MSVLRACRIAAVTLLAMLAALATASSAHAIDTNFRYEINPQHNFGKCIDVPGLSTANSVALQQFECNGGPNQRFTFRAVGSGLYEIRAVHSDKCLDVGSLSQVNGATVNQFSCNNQLNQRFRLLGDQPGPGASSVRIQAAHSNKCLDVAGASAADHAQLVQFECGTQANQKFDLLAFAA